jgi:chemotaxis protein CheD
MPEPETPIQEIYVQPGESHLVSQPAVLRTVLGSCVGVTFLVPRLGIGALCHPMMPSCPPAQRARLSVRAGRRYVDFAIRDIASRLDSLGAVRGEVLVKLFGGNDVLTINGSDPEKTIGKQNYEAALRVLAEEGFTVVASCLGGAAGVHITFETVHGEVQLRWLDSGMPDQARTAPRTAHRANRRR